QVTTYDSAGIILESGSDRNKILRNDLTFGGDGIFIRAWNDACSEDNLVEGNDTSLSPHNDVECWCHGNTFAGNTAASCNFGIWTGGTNRAVIRGNTIDSNLVDGISIQQGQDRHGLIEDNTISNSGRAGILLTGRQYQKWDDLAYWDE